MAAPTEEMSKMDIRKEAPEQKQSKGSKKNQKNAKDKGGSSTHILEVSTLPCSQTGIFHRVELMWILGLHDCIKGYK